MHTVSNERQRDFWLLPDVWGAVVVLLIYTGVCFVFMGKPFSWGDEVQFTDPAANLYFHGKFVTTAWPYQTVNEVFFGNAPLYSLLLGGWYHIVGFGLFETRILSWIFALIGVVYALAALHRSRLLSSDDRIALTALFLTGAGLTVSIWSARYDTLGFAVLAALLYGLTAKETRAGDTTRWVALMLTPLAGFHLPIVVAFFYMLLYWTGCISRREAIIDNAFMIGGGFAMGAYYGITVGLKRFIFLTLFSNHTLLGQVARGASSSPLHALALKGQALLAVLTQDPSYTFVLIVTLVIALVMLARHQWQFCFSRRELALAGGAVVLPILLSLIGKYAAYYSWIGWSCLCVLFVQLLSKLSWADNWKRRAILAGSIVVSSTVGGGAYLDRQLGEAEVDAFRAQLDSAIDREIKPGEVLYSDVATYFDAWRRADHVYVQTYGQNHFMPGFPTPSPVTAIIVRKEKLQTVTGLLGGDWKCVWQSPVMLSVTLADFRICKRR